MKERVKERGISFVTDLVIATEEDRKTVTRRLMKTDDLLHFGAKLDDWTFEKMADEFAVLNRPGRDDEGVAVRFVLIKCACGIPGDRLYIKETYATCEKCGRYVYKAKSPDRRCPACDEIVPRWKSGRFMPKDAARLWRQITNVRVERLQDISETDAKAEGCSSVEAETWWQGYRDDNCGELNHTQYRGQSPPDWMIDPKRMRPYDPLARTAAQQFELLWDAINGKRASWASNPWVWVIDFTNPAQGERSGDVSDSNFIHEWTDDSGYRIRFKAFAGGLRVELFGDESRWSQVPFITRPMAEQLLVAFDKLGAAK